MNLYQMYVVAVFWIKIVVLSDVHNKKRKLDLDRCIIVNLVVDIGCHSGQCAKRKCAKTMKAHIDWLVNHPPKVCLYHTMYMVH